MRFFSGGYINYSEKLVTWLIKVLDKIMVNYENKAAKYYISCKTAPLQNYYNLTDENC
jgi:hypothetical protein